MAELEVLVDGVIATFRDLRVASTDLHGRGKPIPGKRGVLFDLARRGPQAVAAMARGRGVSRQNIQVMVNRFRAEGLVEMLENPSHRRSRLVHLTEKGRAAVKSMSRREKASFASLAEGISVARIRDAAAVLEAISRDIRDLGRRKRR